MNIPLLKIENLSKTIKGYQILNDISLSIYKGDIYLLLGHNGAGKSTLFSCILGCYHYDRGKIFSPLKIEKFKFAGFINQPSFYPHLSALENLKFSYVNNRKTFEIDKIFELSKIFELEQHLSKKVSSYSTGMQKRLAIMRAVLFDSDLIILDEPTTGLDPQGIAQIRELIIKLNERFNKTILISSHIISEAKKVATRVGILKDGQLKLEKNITDLKNQAICIKTNQISTLVRFLDKKQIEILSAKNNTVSIKLDVSQKQNKLLSEIINNGISIEEFFSANEIERLYFDTISL